MMIFLNLFLCHICIEEQWQVLGEQSICFEASRPISLVNQANYSLEVLNLTFVGNFVHRKLKLTESRCLYYSNSCASHRLLLLGGDIESNPGPSKQTATKTISNKDSTNIRKRSTVLSCFQCNKIVRRNQKRLICEVCRDCTHAGCALSMVICKTIFANEPQIWICPKCSLTEMPFHGQK